MLKLLPLLQQAGIECCFLSVSVKEDAKGAEELNAKLRQSGIEVKQIITASPLNFNLLKQINSTYKKGGFSLIHTHLIHADFWAAAIKFLFNRKIKIVSTKHGYDENYQARFGYDHTRRKPDLYYILSVFSEKFINRSAAVSEGLSRFFVGKGISKYGRIETIPHGLDFKAETQKERNENLRFYKKQLIIIGRLVPYKGQRFVIDCLPELLTQYPDLGLVLVGSGSNEKVLKEQAESLGLQNFVRFEGHKKNVHDYLANSDIVVVPSTSEGFGIVLLEAWHHKKPVVAFDVPAPNTIIINNKNGLLIPPFDLQILRDKLAMLIKEPEERKRLGEAGYQSLITDYSPQKMVASTIQFYNKVLYDK